MEDVMAEKAFLVIVDPPEVSEALRMYLEGQGEVHLFSPQVLPANVHSTAEHLKSSEKKTVFIVSFAPFAYVSGNYLIPTFAFAPEDRGKTLSPEDILARLKDISLVAAYNEDELHALAPLGGRFAEAAKAPVSKVVAESQGLVDFLQRHWVVRPGVEVIAHVSDPSQIAGEVVAGAVPPHLAKQALAVEIFPHPAFYSDFPHPALYSEAELTWEQLESKLKFMGIAPPGTRRYAILDLEDPAVLSELLQARRKAGVYYSGWTESILRRTLDAVDIPAPLAESLRERFREVLADMRERGIPEDLPSSFSDKVRIVEATIESALGADRLSLEHVARIQVAADQAFRDLIGEATTAWEAARYVDPVDTTLRDFYREAGLSAGRKEVELG
jgi:hypothetical protein